MVKLTRKGGRSKKYTYEFHSRIIFTNTIRLCIFMVEPQRFSFFSFSFMSFFRHKEPKLAIANFIYLDKIYLNQGELSLITLPKISPPKSVKFYPWYTQKCRGLVKVDRAVQVTVRPPTESDQIISPPTELHNEGST